MNFLLLETTGRHLVFRGGELEGRFFCCGETVFVHGNLARFGLVELTAALAPNFPESNLYGVWCLERRIFRGRPAVCCRFFNKRSSQVEQRYLKIFNSDGYYYCGPRFPRRIRDIASERLVLKKAA